MTWTAPEVTRPTVPRIADERAMLRAIIAAHRTTLLHKCAGLNGEQLAERSAPPSELSLLGLIRHFRDVDRSWIRIRLVREDIALAYVDGGVETAWSDTDPSRAEDDYAALLEEWRICDQILDRHALDDTFVSHRRDGSVFAEISVRWLLLHLIEEYARHLGHADLLRERIDGATGD